MQFCNIKEIFASIQGEGLYAGKKQIFVRFAGCNLNCAYCDTDCEEEFGCKKLSEEELFDCIRKFNSDAVSFTGGEPLMQIDFIHSFLSKYKKYLNKIIYLETNGTLFMELEKVIDFVDIVAMDIKIKSAAGSENHFDINKKFLETMAGKDGFIKVVFDNNIEKEEIASILTLAIEFNREIVLQPKMPVDYPPNFIEVYDEFYGQYPNVRLIPQMHKFLNIR